jgi:thiamine biosynthesis protein ThiS
MIAIIVNGDARIVPDHATVAALVGTLGMDSRKVAVGRNTEFVAHDSYAATPLAAGDQLEIVQRIGPV